MHYSVFIDTIKVLHCPCNLTIDNNLVYLIRIISRTNIKGEIKLHLKML